MTNLHQFLDFDYGPDGDRLLVERLMKGANVNQRFGDPAETPLHVATRRRRLEAVTILLDHGAEIDAENGDGKTAYAHAIRRRFSDVVELLNERGADTRLNAADRFAVAVVEGRLNDARQFLAENPGIARTGNPAEDRLLADVAGREPTEPVSLLIEAGADLTAPALDDGTPLHQACWFGQPANARLLVEAGAPLEIFEPTHDLSPLGWAVHGSRYSGDADRRQTEYTQIVQLLLDAGASVDYPEPRSGEPYLKVLLSFASPQVAELLTTSD